MFFFCSLPSRRNHWCPFNSHYWQYISLPASFWGQLRGIPEPVIYNRIRIFRRTDSFTNLGTQRGTHIKPKVCWAMREAIKTYARRTVHSLCNLCFSPPPPGYCNLQSKISTSVPANLPGAVNYDRKKGLCKQVSARCCYSVIYHRKCMFRRVHQPTHELLQYNLQWKVKILVHANLSNAESYINR